MIVILYVLICAHATCQTIFVSTPYSFQCDDPSFHETLKDFWLCPKRVVGNIYQNPEFLK